MKKKSRMIIAVIVAALAAMMLAACGGKSPQGSGVAQSGPVSGGVMDTGSFTVDVPDGWTAFPQSDIFAEKDEKGEYPVDPDTILLGKGTSDEMAATLGPNVRIYRYDADAYVMDSRGFYDNVVDLEDVKINGTECTGFMGDSLGYRYQFIQYKTDTAQFEIQILVSADGKETGIAMDDPDVQKIMESLK